MLSVFLGYRAIFFWSTDWAWSPWRRQDVAASFRLTWAARVQETPPFQVVTTGISFLLRRCALVAAQSNYHFSILSNSPKEELATYPHFILAFQFSLLTCETQAKRYSLSLGGAVLSENSSHRSLWPIHLL